MVSAPALVLTIALLGCYATLASASASCPIWTCADAGQSCYFNSSVGIAPQCIHNSTCNTTNNAVVSTCSANPILGTLGATCPDANGNLCYASCINAKCNQEFPPGAKCKDDNECAYQDSNGNYFTSCVKKKCAGLNEGDDCSQYAVNSCYPPLTCGPNNTCIHSLKKGAACSSDTHCVQSTVCANSVCSPPTASGAECNFAASQILDQCTGDTICTPTAKDQSTAKCITAFSQAAGSFCVDNTHCGEGLACNLNFTDSSNYTCQPVASSSSHQSCNMTLHECPTHEVCNCNYKNGKGICLLDIYGNPAGIKKAYHDLASCKQKCARSDTPCFASKCSKQYCKYNSILHKVVYDDNLQRSPDCYNQNNPQVYRTTKYNGFFTCDGAYVQYSLVFTLLALLGLLL